jgi:8-amino-7-oxononanoate synthase
MTLENRLKSALDSRKKRSLLRELKPFNEDLVDFSSNDFLSLRGDTTLRQLFLEEFSKTQYIGSGGSRLLDGNSVYAEDLEREICNAHNAECALLFNSGYDANTSVFSSIPQPGDIIVYDEYIHASVHNGMKLSRAAKKISFLHNSVKDLELVLKNEIELNPSIRSNKASVFIALETVYSMDGDICPLLEIVELVNSLFPHNNGYVIVDEAHATGVIGMGLVSHLKLEDKIFIRIHTFGKAMACNGGKQIYLVIFRYFTFKTNQPSLCVPIQLEIIW